ncbi:MAG: hypothetical protein HYT20_00360 [Candidatus Nealsonbacteria bacterium]|nr:hypothetical protein [Candidatus Nealsonbacteria bacterium]
MSLLDKIMGEGTVKELGGEEKTEDKKRKSKPVNKKIILIIISVIIVALFLAGGAYYWHAYSAVKESYNNPEEADPFVRFNMEAYDSILKNYWKQTSSGDLANLFQLSLQKAKNSPDLPLLATKDRVGTAQMLAAVFKSATSTDAEKRLAVDTLIIALYNLPPQGRDGLFSSIPQTIFIKISDYRKELLPRKLKRRIRIKNQSSQKRPLPKRKPNLSKSSMLTKFLPILKQKPCTIRIK